MSDSKYIACPLCLAKNRVPANRLNDGATCGKCGAPLFNNRPTELTSINFDRLINNSDIPVLVDFWAPWCGPCKMMVPIFEQAAQKLEPEVRLGKLNTENEQALAARYAIRSLPTLAIFQNGKIIAQQAGAMNLDGLVSWVNLHTARKNSHYFVGWAPPTITMFRALRWWAVPTLRTYGIKLNIGFA